MTLSLGILTTSLSRNAGGLFQSVRRSAIALHGAGINVTVYGIEDQHTIEDLNAWGPLEPKVFQRVGPAALGYGRGLGRAVRWGGHDILHLHGIWQANSFETANARMPVMISPRGMLDSWAVGNSRLKKQLFGALVENRNLRSATCLHALNQSEHDAIRAFGLSNPVAVIPNGTDMPDTSQPRPRPDWLPSDDKKTLLFLGRLHPKKGLGELLRGWAMLNKESPDVAANWRLVVAGWKDGDHAAELHALAAGLNLSDVLFPGALHGADKENVFAHADAFILPSYSEGLPMAVLEAWAWRLPVFMTEACNLPEGFAEGAATRIMPQASSIAGVLGTALAMETLSDMGERGQTLASSRFAWTPIAEQHIEVYEWMLRGDGETPSCIELGPAANRRVG